MPVYMIDEELLFPPPELAEPDGLLAVGGDLSPQRLVLAYSMGIFPWFMDAGQLFWFSPNPRSVLYPQNLRITKSMRSVLRNHFTITFDQDFERVILNCREQSRPGQTGTWINDDFIAAYLQMHELGLAHSVEVWDKEGQLAGGLYGVCIGKCYFGESMFSKQKNASKAGFITLVHSLQLKGIALFDCQVHTAHLSTFGAEPVKRRLFLKQLEKLIRYPIIRGKWNDLVVNPVM